MIRLMFGLIANYSAWIKTEIRLEWREFHQMHLAMTDSCGECPFFFGMSLKKIIMNGGLNVSKRIWSFLTCFDSIILEHLLIIGKFRQAKKQPGMVNGNPDLGRTFLMP